MEPVDRPQMSKRTFLFGALAGGCALQSGRWAVPAFGKDAPKPAPPHRPSYAQSGEDIIVAFIFSQLGLPQPSYIDIGAYHPYEITPATVFVFGTADEYGGRATRYRF